MLNERAIFAGFGGQGVMLMGQIVAQSGMNEGKEVSWLPSYGPEMRGGTANCAVIVSEAPVASPVIDHNATVLVAMNGPSLDKFENDLLPDSVVLVNSSLIEKKVSRDDVKSYYIDCNDIANELGNLKVANMVMLGAFVEATGCVEAESVLGAMEKKLGMSKAHLMEINRTAFEAGAKAVRGEA